MITVTCNAIFLVFAPHFLSLLCHIEWIDIIGVICLFSCFRYDEGEVPEILPRMPKVVVWCRVTKLIWYCERVLLLCKLRQYLKDLIFVFDKSLLALYIIIVMLITVHYFLLDLFVALSFLTT